MPEQGMAHMQASICQGPAATQCGVMGGGPQGATGCHGATYPVGISRVL